MKILCLYIGMLTASLTGLYAGDVLLEGKAGYYYFTDSTTRDIYGGTALYGLEGALGCCRNISPWVSAELLCTSGETKLEDSDTKLIYVPLGAGLKYSCCFNCFRPYVGAGFLVSYLHTKDDSPFVIKIRNKWGLGAIVKSGVLYDITRCFFVDVFLNYSWMSIDFKSTDQTSGNNADVSGLNVGAGIGYRF